MSFPFGGFKTPEKKKKGRYSGAIRDFQAELKYDEGDPDKYKKNLNMLDSEGLKKKWDKEWDEEIFPDMEQFKKLNLNIWAVGQSHMDIAWLWRTYQIVNKSRITHGKAAWHVNNLDDFTFTFSQPVMLDWLKKESPEIFEEIKKAVKTGRFELQGGTYVEMDGKVPNGEAWCRSRLYGQRWYLENFGKMAQIEWLPDSFGYNNNIPQFSQKSGCNYFHTQKMVGNYFVGHATFPFTHFIWRSPDGSEVKCYSSNFQYRPLERWTPYEDTRRILKPSTKLACNFFTNEQEIYDVMGEIWNEVLLLVGTGDGGHGPTSAEVHRTRYYIKKGLIKGFTTSLDYFKKYDEIVDKLPVWDGAELFYNLHRGTLTTHGLMKKMNRYFEWKLMTLENLLTILDFTRKIWQNKDSKIETKDNFETIHWLWKDTLLLQFHDILPGSSIPEVYDDCYDIWIDNLEKVQNLEQKILSIESISYKTNAKSKDKSSKNKEKTMNSHEIICKFFNGTSYNGLTPIEIELKDEELYEKMSKAKSLKIEMPDGTIKPVQLLEDDSFRENLLYRGPRIIFTINVEPWQMQILKIHISNKKTESTDDKFLKEDEKTITFENDYYKVLISKETGLITEYFDKNLKKNLFSKPGNKINVYRDWSMVEPAWNIGGGYKEMIFTVEDEEIEYLNAVIIENGPVRWSVLSTIKLPESKTIIEQYSIFYKNTNGIFFEVQTDWKQTEAIAKLQFSFTSETEIAVAEGPYTTELMTCDPDKKHLLEKQRWESCCHTWIALPSKDNSWGVSIINDSKYGFDIIKDTIGLTVVRGPESPNASGYAAVERKNRTDGGPPTHADLEEHLIRYAIMPFYESWQESNFQKFAHFFQLPPISDVFINTGNKVKCKSINLFDVKTTPNNLEITSIKHVEEKPKSNSDIILRVVEHGRMKTKGIITFSSDLHVSNVILVDILERDWNEKELNVIKEKGIITKIECEWNPHEILTFKISSNSF